MASAAFRESDGVKTLVLSYEDRELFEVHVPHDLSLGRVDISLDFGAADGITVVIETSTDTASFTTSSLAFVAGWVQSAIVFYHALKQAEDADSLMTSFAQILQYIIVSERTVAAIWAIESETEQKDDLAALLMAKNEMIDNACEALAVIAVAAQMAKSDEMIGKACEDCEHDLNE
jgi:hypothetical protein